jgi:sigma-B regulation protein RsbU (phosphoserine phosphatase)
MSLTELIGAAVGSMLVGLGGASVLVWALRRANRMLLFFGLWCALYGARLWATQPTVVGALPGSDLVWEYVRAFVTYTINVPIGLFAEAILGRGFKGSVRRVWQVLAVYAAFGMAVDLLVGRPRAAMALNSPLILAALLIMLANLWICRGRLNPTLKSRAIAAGAATMLLLVVNENLGRPFVPEVNIEPVGVFLFVAALGFGVVGSVFRTEAELLAVQRELQTARRIQASLLPRVLPNAAGIHLAARYLPMTSVAGDLYDCVDLGASRIGIFVADVSGHGVPAALVASMVKLAFASQEERTDDPAHVLSRINRMLCHHVETTFVTAIYAVVDPGARAITVANAGHPSLLVVRSDRTIDESTTRGLMLGIMAGAAYANERVDLQPGDCIFLYTDGIPEAQNAAGEFLDTEGIVQWLALTDEHDAARFADALLDRLRAWRGGVAFTDDVTFVVARYDETRAADCLT